MPEIVGHLFYIKNTLQVCYLSVRLEGLLFIFDYRKKIPHKTHPAILWGKTQSHHKYK
jgi:hypothetical protein